MRRHAIACLKTQTLVGGGIATPPGPDGQVRVFENWLDTPAVVRKQAPARGAALLSLLRPSIEHRPVRYRRTRPGMNAQNTSLPLILRATRRLQHCPKTVRACTLAKTAQSVQTEDLRALRILLAAASKTAEAMK